MFVTGSNEVEECQCQRAAVLFAQSIDLIRILLGKKLLGIVWNSTADGSWQTKL